VFCFFVCIVEDLSLKTKEFDSQMKKKIYQDHLNDLFSSEYKKAKEESNYQSNFSKNIKHMLLIYLGSCLSLRVFI